MLGWTWIVVMVMTPSQTPLAVTRVKRGKEEQRGMGGNGGQIEFVDGMVSDQYEGGKPSY